MDALASTLTGQSPYLDAVITPNRSLKPRGFVILVALLVTVNVMLGIVFVAMGAPPVPIFLGLDVLALLIAFHVSYRQGRRRERVRVDAEAVSVTAEAGGRSETLWTSPTGLTRVVIEGAGEHECRVRLMLSGKAITVGRQLSPAERRGLFEAIDDAIRAARRGPR